MLQFLTSQHNSGVSDLFLLFNKGAHDHKRSPFLLCKFFSSGFVCPSESSFILCKMLVRLDYYSDSHFCVDRKTGSKFRFCMRDSLSCSSFNI